MNPPPSSEMIKLRHQSFKNPLHRELGMGDDTSDDNEDSGRGNDSSDNEHDKDYLIDYSSLNQDLYQQLKDQEPPKATAQKEGDKKEDVDESVGESLSPFPSMSSLSPSIDSHLSVPSKQQNYINASLSSLQVVPFRSLKNDTDVQRNRIPNTSFPNILSEQTGRATSLDTDRPGKVRVRFQLQPKEEFEDGGDSSDDSNSKPKGGMVSFAEFIKEEDKLYVGPVSETKPNSAPKGKKFTRLHQLGRKSSFSKLSTPSNIHLKQPESTVPHTVPTSTFKVMGVRYAGYGESRDNGQYKNKVAHANSIGSSSGNALKSSTSQNSGTNRPSRRKGSLSFLELRQPSSPQNSFQGDTLLSSHRSNTKNETDDDNNDNNGDGNGTKTDRQGSSNTSMASALPSKDITQLNSYHMVASRSQLPSKKSKSIKKASAASPPTGLTVVTDLRNADATKSQPKTNRRPSDPPNHRSEGLHISSMRHAPLRRPAIVRRRGQHTPKYGTHHPNTFSTETENGYSHDRHNVDGPDPLNYSSEAGVSPHASSGAGTMTISAEHTTGNSGSGMYTEHRSELSSASTINLYTSNSRMDYNITEPNGRYILVFLKGEQKPHLIDISGALTGAGIYDKISRALRIDARSPQATIAVLDEKDQLKRSKHYNFIMPSLYLSPQIVIHTILHVNPTF